MGDVISVNFRKDRADDELEHSDHISFTVHCDGEDLVLCGDTGLTPDQIKCIAIDLASLAHKTYALGLSGACNKSVQPYGLVAMYSSGDSFSIHDKDLPTNVRMWCADVAFDVFDPDADVDEDICLVPSSLYLWAFMVSCICAGVVGYLVGVTI